MRRRNQTSGAASALRVAAFILVGALGLHLANPSESGNPVSESSLHKVFSLAMVQELQQRQENGLPVGGDPLSQVTIEQAPRNDGPAPVAAEESRKQAVEREEEPLVQEEAPLCAEAVQSSVFCVYTVQPGDTLSHVASYFDITPSPAFSPSQLIAFSNGMTMEQSLNIQPGQELRIPVDSGILHVVSASEALSTVAQLYGVSSQAVITRNQIANPDKILPGTVLLIPSPLNAPLTSQPEVPMLALLDDEDEPETEKSETEISETLSALSQPEEPEEADEPEIELAVTLEDEVEETPEPTATPSPEPEQTPEETPVQMAAAEPTAAPSPTNAARTASAPAPAPTREQIAADFAAGFRSVGGSESHLRNILDRVIPCESSYNLKAYNPAGPFHGLMQFLPETWKLAGGGDWHDAWQQGANTARLLQGRDPRSQWPSCW